MLTNFFCLFKDAKGPTSIKLEGDTASKGDIVMVTQKRDELKTAQGECDTGLNNSGKLTPTALTEWKDYGNLKTRLRTQEINIILNKFSFF